MGMRLNSTKRWNDVVTSKTGTLRAVYDSYDLGCKGRLQERDSETGKWITVGYYADYPQLMSAYFKAEQMVHYNEV